MTIFAKIIADSVSNQGKRITTLQLRYPKFIHGEAKTHRKLRAADAAVEMMQEVGVMDDPALSRNASSSRAIPVNRLIDDVLRDPVMPLFWGANQAGMQADQEMDPYAAEQARREWISARDAAIFHAKCLAELGAHKQIVNRIIEPYSHINTIVTATDWANFFHLRLHKDAQPEIRALAEAMAKAMALSTPRLLDEAEWHLPYVTEDETHRYRTSECQKMSAARCARVSYLTHEGKDPDMAADIALFDRLAGAEVMHASPLEHQARPDRYLAHTKYWADGHLHGNLTGWIQFRKLFKNEAVQG